MTLSLDDFATGDTDYISKLNANNSLIETTVNGLDTGKQDISEKGAANGYASLGPDSLVLITQLPDLSGIEQGYYRVRAATTAALPACTYSGGGLTLTGNSNGALAAQDGVTLVLGNDLLVQNQATGAQNGLYDVTQVGSGGAPFILTRSSTFDASGDIASASLIGVSEGTTYGGKLRILTAPDPIVLDTTALTFADPSSAGSTLPVDDTTALVRDPADNTKLVRIDAGAVATATTRTITMPDANIDLTANTGTYPAATHGSRHISTGADAIPAAVASGASGLLTGTDKAKLDGIASGAQVVNEANVTAALPVSDATSLVHDPADATRRMRVDVGAVATGTVRVLTMPDANVDLTADLSAATASLRTLGTGAAQAAPGDNPTLSTSSSQRVATLGIGVAVGTAGTIKMATAAPTTAGEIGMDAASGRAQLFVGGAAAALVVAGDASTVTGGGNYLDLSEQSSAPSTPSSGHARLYAEAVGSTDGAPRWKNDSGADYYLGAHPSWGVHQLLPTGSTFTGTGICANSAFVNNTATNGCDADGMYRGLVSGALAGNNAHFRTASNFVYLTPRLFLRAKIRIPTTVANIRFFFGVCAGISEPIDGDDPAAAALGVQFSPGRGDTTFQFMKDDSSAQALTDSTITAAANTVYIMELDYHSATLCILRILSSSYVVLASTTFTSAMHPAATATFITLGLETTTTAARTIEIFDLTAILRGNE